MLGLFKKTPVIDPQSSEWLFAVFDWCMNHFNAQVFYHETILVLPNNEHFPGRENSVHGMANLIFKQVKQYAGLTHWPCHLVDDNNPVEEPKEIPMLESQERGKSVTLTQTDDNVFIVPYNANQIAKPEALIASYAHILAHYLATMAKQTPPGGGEYWPYATEVVAVYLGFGLMLANSAYTYRGGCGSCYNPLSERSAFLSQDEVTYALAIFCALKNIPNQQVLPQLKSYLRPLYKRAAKEIQQRGEFNQLRRYCDLTQG